MESSPESRQPLGLGAEAAAAPAAGTAFLEGGADENQNSAGHSPEAKPCAEPGGARDGQGAAAGPGSLPQAPPPGVAAPDRGAGGARPGPERKHEQGSPAASEAPRGQRKVTAASEEAEAGAGATPAGTGPPAPAAADAGGGGLSCGSSPSSSSPSSSPGSSSVPSPPGESPSLDSLESFSNLHSCPSSEDGPEPRGSGEEEAAPGGAAPLCPGEGEAAQVLAASKERFPGQSVYHIKWIQWKEENTPIITQNENGPCPLLAILNVLFLSWKVKLPPMMEIITAEQLMEYLGDYILDAKPKEISEIQRLNYEQITDIVKAVGNCSYNQLVEKIISCKQSDNSELVSEGFVAEQFLNNTATQLTYHGLCELTSAVQEGELCVFFRNNHFSTMTKYKGQLYLLVTDQGFLTEEKVVWESLHNVDGDGNFCDSEFHLRPPSDPETVYRGQQDQIDQDYLMALSLQQEQQSQEINWEQIPEGISDLELAKKLQEEEDRRASQYYQEQEQAAAAAAAAAATAAAQAQQSQPAQVTASPLNGRQSGSNERKRKEPREKEKEKEKNSCVIL
ncbi:ubiquitin carboxyl-terminal hydrolase MINDY-2 isoform X3 [Notamacropus eugenii]|uniref:ubiquitin carboxyl-terminal hydrolase MINDY-2 isoform X3 n=1 Tax=Notamacropus eugenii TaxID=9315 RepID=UPI003B674D45